MRKLTVVLTSMLIVFSLVIVASAEDKMPEANAQALWNYITKVSPYKTWSFWPDHKGMQKGRAPHGPWHKVYVNDKALNSSKAPVHYGAIEVKENYDNSKKLKVITVMYKVKGYNPAAGDWFWVKYRLNGKADKFGKPKGCIRCHGVRADNDYISVHEFK